MVGDAAKVAGAGPGPQGLVAGVDVVMDGQEGWVQDGQGAQGGEFRRNEGLVDELPPAFKADGTHPPAGKRLRQVDQPCFLGVPEETGPASDRGSVTLAKSGRIRRKGQEPENRAVRGIVEVADGKDTPFAGCLEGVRDGPEPAGGRFPAPIGVAAAVFGWEMAHQDGPSPSERVFQLCQQDIPGI